MKSNYKSNTDVGGDGDELVELLALVFCWGRWLSECIALDSHEGCSIEFFMPRQARLDIPGALHQHANGRVTH
jgi:hypothetical protein